MALLIVNDAPKELIKLLPKVDFSSISNADRPQKLRDLKQLADKFIPARLTPVSKANVNVYDLPNVPNELANLINTYEWKKVPQIKISLAMPIIKSFMKNAGFLRA